MHKMFTLPKLPITFALVKHNRGRNSVTHSSLKLDDSVINAFLMLCSTVYVKSRIQLFYVLSNFGDPNIHACLLC